MQVLQVEEGLREVFETVVMRRLSLSDRRDVPRVEFDIPKHMEFGDLTTNIAMRLAKQAKQAPVALAEQLAADAAGELSGAGLADVIERFDVKAPGFINMTFRHDALRRELRTICEAGERYGAVSVGNGEKLLLEFVSCNPTGPMSIAHGRQAAFGDALARILRFCGFDVLAEFYVNDEGHQIFMLGQSIAARYRQLRGESCQVPEDGYRGEYLLDVAKRLPAGASSWLAQEDGWREFARAGIEQMLEETRQDLERFRVSFDNWYPQSGLTQRGHVTDALERLKRQGLLFEEDGAWWFRSTAFGDDKDRVVIKKDGEYTYLSSDIAYHEQKYLRGYTRVVDVWGPDHHGYIARVRASIQALGHDPAGFQVLIIQLTTLYRNGQPVRMSTRAGELVTLKELIDEVGVDVARFFFLMRKADSHLDFDLQLAQEQSPENPVYYIQYAYARIASIQRYQQEKAAALAAEPLRLELLREPEEIELMRVLCRFPHVLRSICGSMEPYHATVYLQELAACFHRFYARHRVVTDDLPLSKARLFLVEALLVVLGNGLRLLGVSRPERMEREEEPQQPVANSE